MRSMKFLCPVCGYWNLPRPAADDLICPCCGTQFGYHDYAISHDALRHQWIHAGARWHSRVHASPPGWDAQMQLIRSGLLIELRGMPTDETRTNSPGMTSAYAWTAEAKAA